MKVITIDTDNSPEWSTPLLLKETFPAGVVSPTEINNLGYLERQTPVLPKGAIQGAKIPEKCLRPLKV